MSKTTSPNLEIKSMETPKTTSTVSKHNTFQGSPFLFDKQNYIFMAIGLAVIILGYILMSGGKSKDPNVFNESEIYSFTRITLAPLLVLIGLGIEGYAIMKKPNPAN